MKEPLLPLYIKQQRPLSNNRRYLFNCNIKWLIALLLVVSLTIVYLLFVNLPQISYIQKSVDLQILFVPEVNVHSHESQHPAPPIDVLNQKHGFKTTKTTTSTSGQTSLADITRKRRETVKQMMLLSWKNYELYAWGQNELRPLTKVGHSNGIFGADTKLGATIIDALDTLLIMGLFEEFDKGRDWIRSNFTINNIDADVSAFEINIRFIGGLLSAYALTKDKLFLDKALHVADALLPIFNTPTGLPLSKINPLKKMINNYNWASSSCSILSEIGTLQLEFQYLSDLSGNQTYANKVKNIQNVLNKANKEYGLYYIHIDPNTAKWCGKHASVGAYGDSFYEYLLKSWLYSNRRDDLSLKMYIEAVEAIRKHMIKISPGGLTYVGEFKGINHVENKMDHLSCFIGGLFALTAKTVPLNDNDRQVYLELAQNITHTCHESYIRTTTHIGPESFHFENIDTEAQGVKQSERFYILRPEVIESYFYLWRLTKDNKYRDWAWDVVEAIEKYCKTSNGYAGINNVYDENPIKDDVQQSFFLAETLKYLYLIFSDDDVIPLDKFVFNTEAHPFLIKST